VVAVVVGGGGGEKVLEGGCVAVEKERIDSGEHEISAGGGERCGGRGIYRGATRMESRANGYGLVVTAGTGL